MKTLTVCFNCVNTRLSSDTKLLMRNLTKSDYNKMKIDRLFIELSWTMKILIMNGLLLAKF